MKIKPTDFSSPETFDSAGRHLVSCPKFRFFVVLFRFFFVFGQNAHRRPCRGNLPLGVYSHVHSHIGGASVLCRKRTSSIRRTARKITEKHNRNARQKNGPSKQEEAEEKAERRVRHAGKLKNVCNCFYHLSAFFVFSYFHFYFFFLAYN